MTEQSSYLIMAKTMEAEMLHPRFAPFDVAARFFLELIAGKKLLRLFRGGYKPLRSRLSAEPDDDRHLAEAVIRRSFIPLLADPVFDPERPAPTSSAFQSWIDSAVPPGLEDTEFSAFVKSCIGVVDNYQQRREREQSLLRGIQIIAYFGALLYYCLMLLAFVLNFMRGDHSGVLVVILSIILAKCLGSLVSLSTWPRTS